jgi:hypothetical protein
MIRGFRGLPRVSFHHSSIVSHYTLPPRVSPTRHFSSNNDLLKQQLEAARAQLAQEQRATAKVEVEHAKSFDSPVSHSVWKTLAETKKEELQEVQKTNRVIEQASEPLKHGALLSSLKEANDQLLKEVGKTNKVVREALDLETHQQQQQPLEEKPQQQQRWKHQEPQQTQRQEQQEQRRDTSWFGTRYSTPAPPPSQTIYMVPPPYSPSTSTTVFVESGSNASGNGGQGGGRGGDGGGAYEPDYGTQQQQQQQQPSPWLYYLGGFASGMVVTMVYNWFAHSRKEKKEEKEARAIQKEIDETLRKIQEERDKRAQIEKEIEQRRR